MGIPSYYRSLLLASLALVSACHPDYMRDGGYTLARASGISDDYVVERNKNLALPIQSQLCVASGDESDKREVLVGAVADAFSQRFAGVSTVKQSSLEHASRADLACRGAAFLIQAEALGEDCEVAEAKPGEEVSDSGNERCNDAHIRLKILSVAVESTVDIIDIRYSGSWTGLKPSDYRALISPGLQEAARLLAGR